MPLVTAMSSTVQREAPVLGPEVYTRATYTLGALKALRSRPPTCVQTSEPAVGRIALIVVQVARLGSPLPV